MQLYNYRNKTIGLFENKYIRRSAYALDTKSESEEYDEVKESEQRAEESIAERV